MLPPCYPHATPIPPLTVEVAAQQLQTQGGVPLHHDGLDPDVARHDGRGEAVVLHTGAVHVPLKVLNRDRKHGYTQVTLLTCASIIHLKQRFPTPEPWNRALKYLQKKKKILIII